MWKKILAATALVVPLAAAAQAPWPNKPVTVIIAGAAGSGTDITARLITESLGKAFGQPFVAENRPGANGMIATRAVAKAPADGYTLLFTYAAAQVVNQSLFPNAGYDGAKDFTAIAQVGEGGNVLVVPPSFPARNLQEFIAHVKRKPADEFAYGSWGQGSGGHLSMEALIQQAGVRMRHVPYKGTAPMLTDVLGGHLQVAFSSTATAIPLVQAGKLKALAYSAPQRTTLLPDVPTMNEQGVKFDLVAWYGLLGPSGLPPAVVSALNAEVNRILRSPDMADKLKTIGLSEWPNKSPEEFAATVRRDIHQWGEVIRKGGIKIE